ncbi:MAG: glycosyltransferase family 2 protein [Puniceicoccaceae bacterium]
MVTILILCFNKLELSQRCVQATLDAGYHPEQISVIDNGSSQPLQAMLQERFPAVNCIRLEHNLGFAGGFTQGIRRFLTMHPNCRDFLFLTNDTQPHPGCAEACAASARKHRSHLIAPRLLFRNDPERIDSLAARFERTDGTLHHCRTLGLSPLLQHDEYIPGTAMWMTREAFEQLGGTDESYVMYWEDVDLCFRAHQQGIRMARCEEAIIAHGIGQTCHKKPLYSTYYFQKNRIRFCKKWLDSESWKQVSSRIATDLQALMERATLRNDTQRQHFVEQLQILLKSESA